MRLSGYGFVVGRSEAEGDFKDVRIRTTPEGFNYIEVARDPRSTDPRTYVIDRRMMPLGAWSRVLQVDSFTPGALPETMSETMATVEYEDFRNTWNIAPERTFGLPAGMESPWTEPLEMVGNELLLPEGAQWVSGDAPINTFSDNVYSNGRYYVRVEATGVTFGLVGGRELLFVQTVVGDYRTTMSIEGTVGTIVLDGGVLHIEPAKPPMFIGHFALLQQPDLVQPGLYEMPGCFLVSTHNIEGGRGGGALSVVADPYPERWIPRMMCRAFPVLVTPSNVPPLVEEEPRRISVAAIVPDNDYPDVTPKVVTPYANKVGVFNAWDAGEGGVRYAPSDRPWDMLLPFNGELSDLGGHAVETEGLFRPADDRKGEPYAAFPTREGYQVRGLRIGEQGTLFWRWKDSAEYSVLRSEDVEVYYKKGYVYFTSFLNADSTGIARIPVTTEWNDTKIDWTPRTLRVNDKPALTEEKSWEDATVKEDGTLYTWAEVGNIDPTGWRRNPDLPKTIEQYDEIPPTWDTGLPEDEAPLPDTSYEDEPRTWGRVLFEGWEGVSADEEAGSADVRAGDADAPAGGN